MVESVPVPGIGRIRESTKKLCGRVPEKIESLRVSGIGKIRESTKKLSGRVPENGKIGANTGNR